MNPDSLLNWKSIVALGIAIGIVILCVKLNPISAEKVLVHAIDACKELAVALPAI